MNRDSPEAVRELRHDMKKPGKKTVFRPWNALLVLGIFGIILCMTRYNIRIPEIPRHYYVIAGIIAHLFIIIHFARLAVRHCAVYKWKTTQAIITGTQLAVIESPDGDTYEPRISYRYSVGMNEYTATMINPSNSWLASSFPSLAAKVIEKHPAGKTVRIFYNPSCPADSFIERKGLVPVLVFLLMFMTTLTLLILALAGVIPT